MKKILFAAILIFAAFGTQAQFTTPRFGTAAGDDNTGRVLTYRYVTLTDKASATLDTITIRAKAYENIYRAVLVDSLVLGQPDVTNCYAGDQLIFVLSAASGTPFLRFSGNLWITAGTATMTTRLRSIIKFIFDGASWVESGRYTQ